MKKMQKTDVELATEIKFAMDRLCKAMSEARKAGLHVKCDGFQHWYGDGSTSGPPIHIERVY